MGNDLMNTERGELARAVSQQGMSDLMRPLIEEIHLFDTYISGTSLLKDPSVLERLTVGQQLILRREESKFDANAVMLMTESQEKVGYIPERDELIFARLMDAGKTLAARIRSTERRGPVNQIVIGIYLVDF